VCLCLAESIGQMYLVAPPEFALARGGGSATVDQLRISLNDWMGARVL